LERNEWHVTKTAKELGLSDHASLLKIMRRWVSSETLRKGVERVRRDTIVRTTAL